MLDGVVVVPRLVIPDMRGSVRRIWREEDQLIHAYEVYVSTVYPGVVKGWHGYFTKDIFYSVVVGNVKLVLYDNRENSPTYQDYQEIVAGERNPLAIKIPCGVMNAFIGIGQVESVVVVVADEPFDESTTIRWPLDRLEYDWIIK